MHDESTVEVPLTQGKVALIDAADADDILQYKWCYTGRYAARALPRNRKPKKHISMHQQLMKPPPGFEVDHINRNGLDNRRSNMRVVTHAQNAKNLSLRKNNTSGFHGISFRSDIGKWCAQIRDNGRKRYLGLYATAEDAARAYDAAAKAINGEFATLNFPD